MTKPYFKTTYNMTDLDVISGYDDLPFWSAPFGYMLLNTIPMQAEQTVLDIGCGTGFPLIEIAQRLNSSTIYGIDPWDETFNRINLKTQIHNIQNINLVKGYAEVMPFSDSMFDLIVSNNGLNNVSDIHKTLNEIYRVLKNKGEMVFTVNLPDTMYEFYVIFKQILEEWLWYDELSILNNHINQKRHSEEKWKDLLSQTGFFISKTQKDIFKWRFTNGTSFLNYSFIRMYFLPSWREIVKNRDQNIFFNELEYRLNIISQKNNDYTVSIPYMCITTSRV